MHYTGSWRPHVQRGCFSSALLSWLRFTAERTSPRTGHLSVTLRSGSILGPVWGPFRYPPLLCRGKALAGSGGRYVSRRRVALGVGSPCNRGSVPVGSIIRRFTRPGGRDPCRGRGGGLRCERACQGLPGLSGDSVRCIAGPVPTLLNAVRLCICRYWPISQVRKVLRTFFALFSSLNAVRLCIC